MKKIKALLLAAGYGTRLRPLTLTVPKCLVEINGEPLLKILLRNLNTISEINQLIVATSDLEEDDIIEKICTDSKIECFEVIAKKY